MAELTTLAEAVEELRRITEYLAQQMAEQHRDAQCDEEGEDA